MVARVSLWLRKKIVAAAMGVCDEPPGPRLTPPPPFLTDLLVCRLLYIFIYLFVFVPLPLQQPPRRSGRAMSMRRRAARTSTARRGMKQSGLR